jgi:hypothetical protein
MPGPLFPPLDIRNPGVPHAVALLRTTGDTTGAEFWARVDQILSGPELGPGQLIYGLAAVACELGGRYFGSLGAFLDALKAWQDAGSGPLPSPGA